jgi:hypothetical protein
VPTVAASYLYTFIALMAVSSLLVFAFMDYAEAFRSSSELRRLQNLVDLVAAKSTEISTLALATNTTARVFIQTPTSIGSKQYWLRLENDSEKTWLEGGLGDTPLEGVDLRVYLPKMISAEGRYVSGYGAARLTCSLIGSVPRVKLATSSESD